MTQVEKDTTPTCRTIGRTKGLLIAGLTFTSVLGVVVIGQYLFAGFQSIQHPSTLSSIAKEIETGKGESEQLHFADMAARLDRAEETIRLLSAKVDEISTPSTTSDAASPLTPESIKTLAEQVRSLTSLIQDKIQEKTDQTALRQKQNSAVLATVLSALSQSGQPFVTEWRLLKIATIDNPLMAQPVATLAPLAEKGVLSRATLTSTFLAQRPELEGLLRRTTATQWRDRVWAEVRSLIHIRQLQTKTSEDSILDQITDDLNQGDLQKALEKLAVLPPDVAMQTAAWQTEAQNRLLLDKTLAEIALNLAQKPLTEAVTE